MLTFASALGHLGDGWIGGCCDPEQSAWFLAWTPYAMAHGLNPLLTDHLNYPSGVNLMWNSAMHLPALLSAPLQATVGAVAAYNVMLMAAVALSAWAAYLAARRFTTGHVAPLACGVLYGFSPYMLSQAIQHLPLVICVVPPLVLLVLEEMARRQTWSPYRAGAALGALAAAQLLIDEEVLASMVLVGAIGIGVAAVQWRRQLRAQLPYFARALGFSLVVFALLAAWPLATQFLGPERVTGQLQAKDIFVTDLLNLVVPTRFQLLVPPGSRTISAMFTGLVHEQDGYLGLPLLSLLVFVAITRRRHPVTRLFAVLAGITTLLSMGPHLHVAGTVTSVPLPWLPLGQLPVVGNILPGRLMLYTFLFAGIAVVQWPVARAAEVGGRRAVPAFVIVFLALVPLAPLWPFPAWDGLNPAYFAAGAPGMADGAVVMIAPFIRDGGNADPMLWAAETGDRIRMPQGYFFIPGPDGTAFYGALPSPLVSFMEDIQENPRLVDYEGPARKAIVDDLVARRVDTIAVGPMSSEDVMVHDLTLLLRRQPDQHVGDVFIWRNVLQHGVPLAPPS